MAILRRGSSLTASMGCEQGNGGAKTSTAFHHLAILVVSSWGGNVGVPNVASVVRFGCPGRAQQQQLRYRDNGLIFTGGSYSTLVNGGTAHNRGSSHRIRRRGTIG